MVKILTSIVLIILFLIPVTSGGQESPRDVEVRSIPSPALVPAPPVALTGPADSNSPSFWRFAYGRPRLYVMTSWWDTYISSGFSVHRLGSPKIAPFTNINGGGRWMESVLEDDNGTLYGYYHNEPLGLCGSMPKTAPRIGAARSVDNGSSWEDLGIVLELPGKTLNCDSPNEYFAGGIGDFTVILNEQKTDAYFFMSAYSGTQAQQGVIVGRMLWTQRDNPRGNVFLWNDGGWRPSIRWGTQIRGFFQPSPIYPAKLSWHDDSGNVDSFWGPSVHFNTFLNRYVMLLNRASDAAWSQEGVYIAFSGDLDNPAQWTQPIKIIDGGDWYPQVMGLEREMGTDKRAGAVSRLFLRGYSDVYLVFGDQNALVEGTGVLGVHRKAESDPIRRHRMVDRIPKASEEPTPTHHHQQAVPFRLP